MRIKGGGRVMVEVPRRERARTAPAVEHDWYRDAFDVAPVQLVSRRLGVTMVAVVRDLAEAGRARLADDLRARDRAAVREVGRLLGGLTAEVVIELINHFAQRARPAREGPMVVLGELVGALFVEFWARQRGPDAVHRLLEAPEAGEAALRRELGVGAAQALERFLDFLEVTEGQPTRRLAGTLYAVG